MAGLKSRIQRLNRLKNSGNGSRLNPIDLFLVGALAGLYSKKLLVDEEKSTNKSSEISQAQPQKDEVKDEIAGGLGKTQSHAASDRLSASVSDYFEKLELSNASTFSKGFYNAQVDYIAKAFDKGANSDLEGFTRKSIAQIQSEKNETSNLSNSREDLKTLASDQDNILKPDGIEKVSSSQSDPNYEEIINEFKEEMDLDSLIDAKPTVDEHKELVKTAEIDESFDARDFSEDNEQNLSEKKEVEPFDADEDLTGSNNEEKIELADAQNSSSTENSSSSSGSNPSSTGEAAAGGTGGAAAGSTTSSIFGAVGMAPVVGAGVLVAGVAGVAGGGSSGNKGPLLPVVDDTTDSTDEEDDTEIVSEIPVSEPSTPIVDVVTDTPVSAESSASEAVEEEAAAVLSFQGRVVDGYVVGATVFYDANSNGILDDSESGYVGVTNADGTFSLPDFSAANPDGSVVVLPGGIDTNTGHEIGAMQVSVPKDADGNAVLSDATDPNAKTTISSPLTLILAQNSDIVEADLIAQLGMTGVEDTGLAYYDPVTEMQAGNNNSLAEYVFTVQQQLFSVIQAGSKIAGTASGLSALEVSVKAVGVAITTALENGEAITVSDIATSAITSVANASGFSSLASSFVSIVNAANTKIEQGYSGLASALSDPTNTDSIDLLSNARATAAASQDTLLSTISSSLSSGSLDVAQFNTDLTSVIAENTAVFGTVLQAEAGDGSSGLSEFGNPAFIVQKLLEQTGTADRDILDLSSSINTMSLEQLSQLGVKHVRLLGSNTSVEISLGDVTTAILSSLNDDATTDDASTTLVDEASVDDALFASNYSVTLKVTDTDVQTVVANATTLNAAGIDIIKPVEGTLTLTLAQVQELNTLGFEFASGLVRFSASASDNLTFDEIYTLLNAGLKLTDASTVTVSIPEGDSRSTFSTVKDLAASGVSFDGGTITLGASDVTGSFNVLQAQLLDAAKSNIVFDTSALSGWSLGKASDGTSLGNPVIEASDVTYLLGAGLTFNEAIVNVTSTTDVTTIVDNAFDLLTAGVRKFNFSSGVSITTDNATLLLDAKALTVSQGVTYSDTIISGSGVLSELGSASLQSLSDYLAEGLGLDTSFVPELSDALALVQLGITFPQGITITSSDVTSISQSNAESMVAAGVSFNGTFNVTYTKDSSLTEAENLTSIKSLVQAGLTPVSSSGGLIQVSGTESSPLYLSPDEFSSLKELVEFQNASLVLMRSSDFETAFGDLTTNQSYWEAQTAFSKFAVPLSVTPPYSKFSTLATLNSQREESGVQAISIVRVSKSGDDFTELDTNISVRLSNASDLDTIDVSSLKSSGVDYVDVLGVPLSVTQIQRFQSNDAPTLQNGQLLISNDNISNAATLFTTSADRNIFTAGIESFNVSTGTSATADVWKVFSDAYDTLSGDSDHLTTKIFDGGIITGSGALESGVGQVLDRLSSGGLVLSDSYSPSLTEVQEYIDSGGSYSKGIKISLLDGETLTPSEAILLAQANVSFTANTPLDFTGQTKNDLLGSVSESSHVTLFKKLLAQGFLMQNLSDDLLNLDQVTVTPADFETLKTNGFNFTNSKIEVTNKMELISVSVSLVDETDHGISHIVIPSTLNPTFGQTKQILGAGVAFDTQSDDSSGTTVKVNSVGQLESLVINISNLDQMGVTSLDLEGINIPWDISKQFAEVASSVNLTFTNQPGILIGSNDDLSEVAPLVDQLYQLGARTISFEDGIEIEAKAANDIIVASENITFSNGSITSADEIADSDLKQVLSSLKNKGLGVSSDFKPSVSIPMTDDAQIDSEQISLMIRDGYRIKSFVDSSDQSHSEHEFSNVFLSISDYQRFSDSGNFDDEISTPSFRDSHVIAKNSQDLTKISTDLQSDSSSLGQLNLTSIALVDGLSPNLDQLNQFIDSGFSLVNAQTAESGYSLSTSTGISLRPSNDELAIIANNADGFYAAGITKLGLYGKEIEVTDAQTLLSAGFDFEGGKIKASTNASENTLNYLTPLAQAGLALPDEISLIDSIVSYDFAINSFKGSLAGASIDLSDMQGADAINVNQVMRLVNRDLGQDLNNNPSAFLSSDPLLSTPILVNQNDQISSNIAEKVADLGFNKVVGSIKASNVVNLFPVDDLDTSELAIKGDITVDEAVGIIDAGKIEMFSDVKIKDNSEVDLVSAKKILTIDPLFIDLNEVALTDRVINAQDFFDVHENITLPSNLTITGNLDSVAQANALISLSSHLPEKSFVNLLLRDDDGLIASDADSIAHLINHGVSVYDGFSPTVVVTEDELTPQNAIDLSRGFVDLSNKGVLQGEFAQIDQIIELSGVEGFSIQGVSVARGEELHVVSKHDVLNLAGKGVVFNSDDGLPLYALSEEEFNPIEAIELNALGGDLTEKVVSFNGYVPPVIAGGLSSINGVDLSNVFAKKDGLSQSQIIDLESKGGKVNYSPEIISESSIFNGTVSEISDIDPRGQNFKINTSGTVSIDDDQFSEYQAAITPIDSHPGDFEVTFAQNTETGLHEIDWKYEIDAQEIEYLAQGEVNTIDYQVSISESFFEFDSPNVAEFDASINILGSDDQPIISFNDESDISQLVREGGSVISSPISGVLNIEERDVSDKVTFKLKEFSPSIIAPSQQISDEVIDPITEIPSENSLGRNIEVPIKFSITELNTENVVWELNPSSVEFSQYGTQGQGFYSETIVESIGVGKKFEEVDFGHSGHGFYSEAENLEVGSGVFLGDQVHFLEHGANGAGYYSSYFEDYGLSGYQNLLSGFFSNAEYKLHGVSGEGYYDQSGNYGSGEFAAQALLASYGINGTGYYSEVLPQVVGHGDYLTSVDYYDYGTNGAGYYVDSISENIGVGDVVVQGYSQYGNETEYLSPEFSSGEYELEWEITNQNIVYEQLDSGEILATDWVLEVTDHSVNVVPGDDNLSVSQEIELRFQANSSPQLIDSNTNLSPVLEKEILEDEQVILNPYDFGYQFYLDADEDLYNNIEISQLSDDVNLYVQSRDANSDQMIFLSSGDSLEIITFDDLPVFSRNDEVVNLVFSPDENINGTRSIVFDASDGISLSELSYQLDIFVSPVVDNPLARTSTSPIDNVSEITSNIKFLSDPSTVYFNLEAVGENSELVSASLEIAHEDIVLDVQEFDDGFNTNYEYNLVSLMEKHDLVVSDDSTGLTSNYGVTGPVTANILVDARDVVEGIIVEKTFAHKEEITIIPSSTMIKENKEYEELVFGSSDLNNGPISNFSESVDSDSLSFIDPTYETVVSTDEKLDGQDIDFDAEAILGTDGDDFIFANTSNERDHGTLIHGGLGFDDLTGSEYDDIIYLDHTGDKGADVVSGGEGNDVFVISDSEDNGGFDLTDDPSKIDMEQRLNLLLENASISHDQVTIAGVIDDFSIENEGNNDNLVLEGFSESSEHSVTVIEDMAVVLIQEEEESVEKFYTAAILMPEYGSFDSSDMDLLNESIHKM